MSQIVRIAILGAFLASACKSVPDSKSFVSFVTSSGIKVDYVRCEIHVVSGDLTYQLNNVRLTEGNVVRTNPKIRFDGAGVSKLTGLQANSRLGLFDELFAEACGPMYTGTPLQIEKATEFHDMVVKATFEVALEFDRLATEAEFQAELRAAKKIYDDLILERSKYLHQ